MIVKKAFCMLLILSLLLSGCASGPAETTAPGETAPPTTQSPTTQPSEAPTETPTEAPTEPPVIHSNPLNGEILEEPHLRRNFAVSINNVPGAMPLHGVGKADLVFEMFINDYATRLLAIYSDAAKAEAIGSIRSLRYNFTDLCETFDAVVVHASGSRAVMNDLAASPVENLNVGSGGGDYHYRDQSRLNQGFAWEHCLFVNGPGMVEFVENRGTRVTVEPGADYGLRFTEDATPAGGEAANVITIDLVHDSIKKTNQLKYDEAAGKYHFWQYGSAMHDGHDGEPILFENVIVMLCRVYNKGVYHIADLIGSGEGYFACNGRIIPIRWSHESNDKPIVFTLADGTPLELGMGSSYIAVAPLTSSVGWE